ncbi:hypothetical protein [Polymorphobacter sp.]|uniref:hypothetical protein n=1 Tax=Polymorphobacter sp. TaxID=1909290 RepID=UPI003F722821
MMDVAGLFVPELPVSPAPVLSAGEATPATGFASLLDTLLPPVSPDASVTADITLTSAEREDPTTLDILAAPVLPSSPPEVVRPSRLALLSDWHALPPIMADDVFPPRVSVVQHGMIPPPHPVPPSPVQAVPLLSIELPAADDVPMGDKHIIVPPLGDNPDTAAVDETIVVQLPQPLAQSIPLPTALDPLPRVAITAAMPVLPPALPRFEAPRADRAASVPAPTASAPPPSVPPLVPTAAVAPAEAQMPAIAEPVAVAVAPTPRPLPTLSPTPSHAAPPEPRSSAAVVPFPPVPDVQSRTVRLIPSNREPLPSADSPSPLVPPVGTVLPLPTVEAARTVLTVDARMAGQGGARPVDDGVGAALAATQPLSMSFDSAGQGPVRMALSGGPQALQLALAMPAEAGERALARADDLSVALSDQGVRLASIQVSAADRSAVGEPDGRSAASREGGGQQQPTPEQRSQAMLASRSAASPSPAAVDEPSLVAPRRRAADRFA